MKRRTLEERRQLVAECRASGKTIKAFCMEKGISVATYSSWSKKIPPEAPEGAPAQELTQLVEWSGNMPCSEEPSLHPNLQDSLASSKIRIISGGYEIVVESGFAPEFLSDVLRVVNGLCF